MHKVLVTGGNGQLAIALASNQFDDKTCFLFSHGELDITNKDQIADVLGGGKYEFVVNGAAYTAVDDAESHREEAYEINAQGALNLASACKELDLKFIHVSTDFVFDGESKAPYTEADETNPVNVYGASKLEGERLVLKEDPSAIVIRTSWLYSEKGKNFMNTMLRLGGERQELKVVNDQIGSPTYSGDLARAILKIIYMPDHWEAGIYNYSNEGLCSWFDFATAIMEIADLDCKINPIPSSEYPTPAKRPKYSVLSKRKIKEQFNLSIPNWRDSLEKCIKNKFNELART